LPAGSAELLEEAHKLKGVADLFGLAGVGGAAAEVEAAARGGGDVSGPVGRLAGPWRPRAPRWREAKLLAG
jgi:HPt (histidine-containing phosphotransfer) domain-containing protein